MHVTYIVAGETVDDFVQTVLAAKAALVGAVIEGRALDQLGGNVLEELERLGAISPELADLKLDEFDEADVARVLRETVDAAERERNAASNRDHVVAHRSSDSEAMRRAVELLVRILAASQVRQFLTVSTARTILRVDRRSRGRRDVRLPRLRVPRHVQSCAR